MFLYQHGDTSPSHAPMLFDSSSSFTNSTQSANINEEIKETHCFVVFFTIAQNQAQSFSSTEKWALLFAMITNSRAILATRMQHSSGPNPNMYYRLRIKHTRLLMFQSKICTCKYSSIYMCNSSQKVFYHKPKKELKK